MEDRFDKCQYSLEELEAFRDKEGFIDLTQAGVRFTTNSREIRGTVDRIKHWVDFAGTKALIKGENMLEEGGNYGIYAEVIVEEVAKELGVENAHCDLVKITDDSGKVVHCVLSQMVMDVDHGERLESLHDIIGEEPTNAIDELEMDENYEMTRYYMESTSDYDYSVERLRECLEEDGISEEEIDRVIEDYQKRLVFTISMADTDKHTENISFIRWNQDGNNHIRLAPNFDNECAFMLDSDIPTINKVLNNYEAVPEVVNTLLPKIVTKDSIIDAVEEDLSLMWIETLEALTESDDVFEYYHQTMKKPIDIDEVLDRVESRIHGKLPMNARLMAKYGYLFRNAQMQREMTEEVIDKNGNLREKGIISQSLDEIG